MAVYLRPGTPDDANREYLPESIIGTDIVVNENGNNSIPYPEGLQECTGILADGVEDRWYVYVPKSYDGSKKVPLIVGCHGGLMTGWGHAVYTSWTLVAEREGFICVFPDAHSKRMWTVEGIFDNWDPEDAPDLPVQMSPRDEKENHDLNYLEALIAHMKEQYNIDEGRVFMQGMSMGNFMTRMFAKYRGKVLAGAAGSGGPCKPELLFDKEGNILNYGGPMAIWQSRPEKNGLPPGGRYNEATINKYSRFYWMLINECDPIPQIRIEGEDNFAFYKGRKADMVYLDIKNRDHGQTLDEAFLYWDYLFSGVRKLPDGSLEMGESKLPRVGDAFAMAFSAGYRKCWFENKLQELNTAPVQWQKLKYHGLNGDQIVRGDYLCVPVSFLAKAFGAEYVPSEDTLTATLKLKDGRHVQFARGSIGCVVDDTVRCMYCEALHRNGELLVSVEWFAKYLFNLHVSVCNDVVYVTDHFVDLSYFMADLIKDLFAGNELPTDYKNINID
ncbi:MAG: hypothetical protein PUF71_07325 [Firmicutes bacterium]|nr:hypothetical protein [Bacillota bacterium]